MPCKDRTDLGSLKISILRNILSARNVIKFYLHRNEHLKCFVTCAIRLYRVGCLLQSTLGVTHGG